MDLSLKYRPKTLKLIAGNKDVTSPLLSSYKKGNLPASFLLVGPKGCGKTTIGRIIAKMVGATGRDVHEINTADFRDVGTVRNILREMVYTPIEKKSTKKVYLLDEAHQLGSGGASEKNIPQNALLKALEEPPKHVVFILCTTTPNMLLSTIRSRCVTYKVTTLNENEMLELLIRVVEKEDKSVPIDVLKLIYKNSEGHPREALKMLTKIIDLPDDADYEALLQKENEEETDSIELARALLAGKQWKVISGILKKVETHDQEGIRRMIMAYMRTVLLKSGNERAHTILTYFRETPLYDAPKEGMAIVCSALTNGYEI